MSLPAERDADGPEFSESTPLFEFRQADGAFGHFVAPEFADARPTSDPGESGFARVPSSVSAPESGAETGETPTVEFVVRTPGGGSPDIEGATVTGTTARKGFHLISVRTDDPEAAKARIEQSEGVEYAELNVSLDSALDAAPEPDDPHFDNNWGLHNDGQFTGSKADADIDATEAWAKGASGSGFVTGVVGTGVDLDHSEFAGRIWTNQDEIAGNGIDDDGNGYVDDVHGWDFVNNDNDPTDDHGHETHVAGTIAAATDNGEGVAGVAGESVIMPLKALGANGSGNLFDAVEAIEYATAEGVKLTNNSWGAPSGIQALEDAISEARDAGSIVVAAAGNNGSDNDANGHWPSNYGMDNVVSVAATDMADQLASFSNYGDQTVDLAAPGHQIYSTTMDGGYGWKSGTSMAAPHVTGAIADVWAENPGLDYDQVIDAILEGVDSLSSLSGKVATEGRLNLDKAFDLAAEKASANAGTPVTDFDGDGKDDLLWSRGGADDGHFVAPGADHGQASFAGYRGDQKFLAVGDFDGDGTQDTAWRYDGSAGIAVTPGEAPNSNAFKGYNQNQDLLSVGDFDGDGADDLMWQFSSGGTAIDPGADKGAREWQGYLGGRELQAVADFDGDGADESMWTYTSSNGTYVSDEAEGGGRTWAGYANGRSLLAAGDFDSDGVEEALWQWDSSGGVFSTTGKDGAAREWKGYAGGDSLLAVADFDGDGADDALWSRDTGGTYVASHGSMNERAWAGDHSGEELLAVGDFVGDGRADTVWQRQNGSVYVQDAEGPGVTQWAGDQTGNTVVGSEQALLGKGITEDGLESQFA